MWYGFVSISALLLITCGESLSCGCFTHNNQKMSTGILSEVLAELKRAKKKFPNWPDHPAAQAGIVCVEAGELMQACLQWKYERAPEEIVQDAQKQHMREEAT